MARTVKPRLERLQHPVPCVNELNGRRCGRAADAALVPDKGKPMPICRTCRYGKEFR